MKKTQIYLILALFLLLPLGINAQITELTEIPEGYELVDTVVVRDVPVVDSSLIGQNIILSMPSRFNGAKGSVRVNQTEPVKEELFNFIEKTQTRTSNCVKYTSDLNLTKVSGKFSGFRVRIYIGNQQTSRRDALACIEKFKSIYPEIEAYLEHNQANFKVTVGDFRTRSEAMRILEKIKGNFPSAFIVKEEIDYPPLEKEIQYDTIREIRPIAGYTYSL